MLLKGLAPAAARHLVRSSAPQRAAAAAARASSARSVGAMAAQAGQQEHGDVLLYTGEHDLHPLRPRARLKSSLRGRGKGGKGMPLLLTSF